MPDFPEKIFVALSNDDQNEYLEADQNLNEHVEVGEAKTVGVYTLQEIISVTAEVKTSVVRSAK